MSLKILALCLLTVTLIFAQSIAQIENHLTVNQVSVGETPQTNYTGTVHEQLSFQVTSQQLTAWTKANSETWTPYLQTKPGYVNTEVYYDKVLQQLQNIVQWSNYDLWKSIPVN